MIGFGENAWRFSEKKKDRVEGGSESIESVNASALPAMFVGVLRLTANERLRRLPVGYGTRYPSYNCGSGASHPPIGSSL